MENTKSVKDLATALNQNEKKVRRQLRKMGFPRTEKTYSFDGHQFNNLVKELG